MRRYPKALILTLTRVALRPERREIGEEIDELSRNMVSACKTKLKHISGQVMILGDICGLFLAGRIRRKLRNREVESIAEAGSPLAITSPPYLLIRTYGFGLSSYRMVVTTEPREGGWKDILSAWRSIAKVLRGMMDERLTSSLIRGSMASHYFSEIYSFYELYIDPSNVSLRWKDELEPEMMPDPSLRPFLLSPMKRSTQPPEPELSFTPDPLYISKDGIFSFFYYSSNGPGKRRNIHQVRRKRRRFIRMAVDLALGLKVYLENEDLWLSGRDDLWGALTGMVHLNPRVVNALWRGAGARFLRPYDILLRAINLIDRFEAYETSFWFPFPSEYQILAFNQVVRLLGGRAPSKVRSYPLTDREFALMRILLLKGMLDREFLKWDDTSLQCLSKLLCVYADYALNERTSKLEGSLVDEILRKVKSKVTDRCSEELLNQMSARKGGRLGLTVRELTILVRRFTSLKEDSAHHAVTSDLKKLEQLEILRVREGRRLRSRKAGSRTTKGLRVTSYELDLDSPLIQPMERIYESSVRKILGGLKESFFSSDGECDP